MKKTAIVVAALFLAVEAGAATVVLTGGKRLDVTGYTVGGSYVTVQYANGRRESYPLSVVDLQATRDANGVKAAPAAAQPETPHSPFLGAKASGATGGVLVTDADVKHIEKPEDGEAGEEAKDEGEEQTGSQIALVGYEKKRVADGQWEIVATVANQGKTAVTGVDALMRVLDEQGKPVATGSGSFAGRLEPGKQATIPARVALAGEPFQVAVDLSWREIKPTTRATATPAAVPAPTRPPTPAPQAPSAGPAGLTVPAGSSPTTMPANVMALPSANVVGAPPQVPRGAPKG